LVLAEVIPKLTKKNLLLLKIWSMRKVIQAIFKQYLLGTVKELPYKQ
jgi:hypothetical protein